MECSAEHGIRSAGETPTETPKDLQVSRISLMCCLSAQANLPYKVHVSICNVSGKFSRLRAVEIICDRFYSFHIEKVKYVDVNNFGRMQ